MIDKVESFDGNSVLLESGSRIKADILVTARESSAICNTCSCPDIWRCAKRLFKIATMLFKAFQDFCAMSLAAVAAGTSDGRASGRQKMEESGHKQRV